MTESEQKSDTLEQIDYLENEATQLGYSDISELFHDEPELFDILAAEYRNSSQY